MFGGTFSSHKTSPGEEADSAVQDGCTDEILIYPGDLLTLYWIFGHPVEIQKYILLGLYNA